MNTHGGRGAATAPAAAGLSLVIDPHGLVSAEHGDVLRLPVCVEGAGGVPAVRSRRPGLHGGVVGRIDRGRYTAVFVPAGALSRARHRLSLVAPGPAVPARPDDGQDTTSDEFGGDAA